MTNNLQSIVDLGREAAESHRYIKDAEANLAPYKKELTQRKTSLNKAIAGAFTQGTDLSPLMGGASVSLLSKRRLHVAPAGTVDGQIQLTLHCRN